MKWAETVGGPAPTILMFIFGIAYLEYRLPIPLARTLKLMDKDAPSSMKMPLISFSAG